MSINGAIDGVVLKVLQAFGVELPGGDGDVLRSIASDWDGIATDLTNRVRALDGQVASTGPNEWSGPARQAFDQHWQQQVSTLDDFAANLHKVADGLRTYAGEIDSINLSIVDICVQIAEMEIAGAALSFFTGFLSDVVANTAVAARVAKIIDLVAQFTRAAEKVSEVLSELFELTEEGAATLTKVLTAFAKISGSALRSAGESFAGNFVADTGSMMMNQALSGQKVDVSADAKDGAVEAGGSAAFAGLTGGIAASPGVSGKVGDFLTGDGGKLSNLTNGALGNISGTGLDDYLHPNQQQGKDATGVTEDLVTAGVTGAYGNSRIDDKLNGLKEKGSFGGANLSEQGKRLDSAFAFSAGTGDNTAVYNAGSGVESDLQNLQQEQQKLAGEEPGQ
ncbi:WXG100 family type VII secretion target [Streptacidiphilus melanogenes]|uniref:WXG100 family type VII secretion target n=1 Tax=Streptacidiphilus melanogenes TaxID=411235 RepID=UPI0005A6AB0D|nr:WXG100 family type VII secretion target [Streptacidiphilus melanogenes]